MYTFGEYMIMSDVSIDLPVVFVVQQPNHYPYNFTLMYIIIMYKMYGNKGSYHICLLLYGEMFIRIAICTKALLSQ